MLILDSHGVPDESKLRSALPGTPHLIPALHLPITRDVSKGISNSHQVAIFLWYAHLSFPDYYTRLRFLDKGAALVAASFIFIPTYMDFSHGTGTDT